MKNFLICLLLSLFIFSCASIEKAHKRQVVYILPFKVYRVEITETGYHYLWVWRYRIRGRIPATCIENGNEIEIGDVVLVDTRIINVHY